MLAMGKGGKNGLGLPIPGSGGKNPGMGWNGKGVKTDPMKGDPKGNPRLTMIGKGAAVPAGAKVSAEFQKYAKMRATPPSHLPNTMVKGTQNNNPTELINVTTADPQAGTRAGTPYYEIYAKERKAIESPVNKENIPAAYRQQVKHYFEQIKP